MESDNTIHTIVNKTPLFLFLSDLQGWNFTKCPQFRQLRPLGAESSIEGPHGRDIVAEKMAVVERGKKLQ